MADAHTTPASDNKSSDSRLRIEVVLTWIVLVVVMSWYVSDVFGKLNAEESALPAEPHVSNAYMIAIPREGMSELPASEAPVATHGAEHGEAHGDTETHGVSEEAHSGH